MIQSTLLLTTRMVPAALFTAACKQENNFFLAIQKSLVIFIDYFIDFLTLQKSLVTFIDFINFPTLQKKAGYFHR